VDAAWQQKTDEILHASRVRQGAVVIIDVKNNRLLAMSSSSPDGTNRAVIPDRPGSVMKVVTAAAAVEAHTAGISSVYYCTGQLMTPSVRMRCWRIHGQEALVGALASSCDIAFAEIGIETGRFALEKMARQCGIYGTGLQTFEGHSILPEAMPGRLFQGQGVDKGLIANTAIGQQDAVISPLQGALLANAVANQGSYAEATLASAFLTSSHRAIAIPTDRGHRAFSRYAASVIAQAMWNAAHQSTGTAYGLRRFNVAVKTGTAELPNRRVNAWTIGFFPAKSPKYAFATVSENESSLLAHRQTFHMDELLLQFASSTKLDQ
jgi:cell division protein FtsI/penicillin-binding protein 2